MAQSLQNGNANGLTKSAKGKALGIQKQVEGSILGQKGDLPTNLVVKILQKAHPHFGVSLGKLVSAYASGTCCVLEVTQVGEKGRAFLVTYGGSGVVIEDSF